MDLRNNQTRRKFDALQHALKRMEQTLYELSLSEAGVVTKPDATEPEPAGGGGGGGAAAADGGEEEA